MNLLYITWNVHPEIFPNTAIPVRWYGLFFVIAFYLSYYILSKIFKREGIKEDLLDKLTIYMLIATVVGARIGHCLFYEPDYYLRYPIEILYIWQGGLASHGAAIAILFAVWIFVRKNKQLSFMWIMDRLVIVVAIAGFWIRMGNLMNSEIFGRPTTLPWGFIFKRLESEGVFGPHHPTQIYEALAYLLIFFALLLFYHKRNAKPKEGLIFSIFLIALFSMRFLIEFIKNEQVDFEKNMTLNMGQWLSLPFIIAGVGLFFYMKSRKAVLEDKDDSIVG